MKGQGHMTEYYSVDQDLREAEAMTKGLETYLKGDTLYASAGGGIFSFGNMPTMTVGALLMRLRRLGVLHMQLNDKQREQLAELNRQHEEVRDEFRAHYEKKMLWEANSRLDSIRQYFSDASTPDGAASNYAPEQLRRTIVQELLVAMDELRIESADIDTKVRQIDSRLNGIASERTGFLWDSQLEPAYPQKDYWWLYRKPRAGRG
jgi:hypothetical protein